MSFGSLTNAVFRITRKERAGDEEATPTFSTNVLDVRGWFDEPAARPYDTAFRSQSVPYQDRRAVFMYEPDADVLQRDEGEILLDGPGGEATISTGRWMVEVVRSVPQPGGIAHYETQVRSIQEGR